MVGVKEEDRVKIINYVYKDVERIKEEEREEGEDMEEIIVQELKKDIEIKKEQKKKEFEKEEREI